jgi:DNA polymerase-3 subunit epsilon
MHGMSNWPQNWQDLRVAVLDVETTGFDKETDRIIEVGIVTFERGDVVERWGAFVNPGIPIPEVVTKLTGITDEMVSGAPPFEGVAAEVAERLTGVGISAYNLSFDRGFVRAELGRAGFSWPEDAPYLDPLVFVRQLHKEQASKKLGDVAARLGIELAQAHRAVDDAEATGRVLYALADDLPHGLDELLILQAQWERLQERERAMWHGARGAGDLVLQGSVGEQSVGLGPGYLYGDELDPLRALYSSVPDLPR